jgi:hypothetical protein
MGIIATLKIVTSVNTVGRATVVRPGHRESLTAIEGINSYSKAVVGWNFPAEDLPTSLLISAPHGRYEGYDFSPPSNSPYCQ